MKTTTDISGKISGINVFAYIQSKAYRNVSLSGSLVPEISLPSKQWVIASVKRFNVRDKPETKTVPIELFTFACANVKFNLQ